MNNRFPKTARLLDSSSYQYVFDRAALKVSDQHSLVLARPKTDQVPACGETILPRSDDLSSRLGIIAAKKKIKRAVDRNRFKRAARETFRHHYHNIPHLDIIVLAKSGAGDLTVQELQFSFNRLWLKLVQRAK